MPALPSREQALHYDPLQGIIRVCISKGGLGWVYQTETSLKEVSIGPGSFKEAAGRAVNDRDLEEEGRADQTGGKVQQGFGKARRKVGEAIEDIGEAVRK